MRSYTNLRGAFRATGASLPFLSRRAHLLTTCEAGGGIPSVGRARRQEESVYDTIRS